MRLTLQCLGRQGDAVQHVLIVGANGRSGHLVQALAREGAPGFVMEGFVDDDPERQAILERLGVCYLGPVALLDQLMVTSVIDRVYVCLPLRSSYDTAQHVLELCEAAGVPVFMVADLLPMHTESDALLCMEPQYTAAPAARPQEEATGFGLTAARAGGAAPLFTALSATLSGLLPGRPVLSEQESRGPQQPTP